MVGEFRDDDTSLRNFGPARLPRHQLSAGGLNTGDARLHLARVEVGLILLWDRMNRSHLMRNMGLRNGSINLEFMCTDFVL